MTWPFLVFYCARHLSKLTSVVSVIFLFRAPPQRGDISLDWWCGWCIGHWDVTVWGWGYSVDVHMRRKLRWWWPMVFFLLKILESGWLRLVSCRFCTIAIYRESTTRQYYGFLLGHNLVESCSFKVVYRLEVCWGGVLFFFYIYISIILLKVW